MDQSERSFWGRTNIGAPAHAVQAALAQASRSAEFVGVRFDAIGYYADRLLFDHMFRFLDGALSNEQVRDLRPEVIKVVFVLLIRDLCRHHGRAMRPQHATGGWEGHWIEQLTIKLLSLTNAPVQPYVDWMSRQTTSEAEDNRILIAGLAHQLHVDARTLYDHHAAMCQIVGTDVLAARGSA